MREQIHRREVSANRSRFSSPSGITAVPSWIRDVRWVAAASTATGDEMP